MKPLSAIFMFCALLSLSGCHRTPDEQRIRNAITAMAQALEHGQPRDFMASVAEDFTGNDGNFDRTSLHNLLRAEVLRNGKLGVILGPIDVELQGDRATVHNTATFTGGAGGFLPERGAVYTFSSGWKREGSKWLCYNASWQQKL